MGRASKGYIVVASIGDIRYAWPYRQLLIEEDGLRVRSWPTGRSSVVVPRAEIHFMAVGQVWQQPYVSAFGQHGRVVASFRPYGDWEKLFAALQADGYKFGEYPPVLPDEVVP